MTRDGEGLPPPIREADTQGSFEMMPFAQSSFSAFDAEPMQILNEQMIGEAHVFAEPVQIVRTFFARDVPEFAKSRLGDGRIPRAKCNELPGGELGMTRQRLENIENVAVGDLDAFRSRGARQVRSAS